MLDDAQQRAVLDAHKNCLVTARAGSGKTRVIVAKVKHLLEEGGLTPEQILIFTFNRDAAAEVNARIGGEARIASTFHKFALDVAKRAGERPDILSEEAGTRLIRDAFARALAGTSRSSLAPGRRAEYLRLTTSFIARAGQKFVGSHAATDLRAALAAASPPPDYADFFRLAERAYTYYQASLTPPLTDFNRLMSRAAELLNAKKVQLPDIRYILIDEYQDFSYLFFALVQAIRTQCPESHLFAVGDDWQAINRFAGSDVDYFRNFSRYFSEDFINIELRTNYRSDRQIVENANDYMLSRYDPSASRAVPFSKKRGKIIYQNPRKLRFDTSDVKEDALGDGRFMKLLPHESSARLLKQVAKICRREQGRGILLLHRHNFLTDGTPLPDFQTALETILSEDHIPHLLRTMTIHKSKGLESDVVVLLQCDREQVLGNHPTGALFAVFGDSRATEKSDQHRLLYVALTRAKHRLYILSSDDIPPTKITKNMLKYIKAHLGV